jgi:CubicO group peptidase (beta-lactamase class C family)
MSAVQIEGFAKDRFSGVRAAFAENFAKGDDIGASVCITQDGETVVDLWGGFADAERTRPWTRDTIVNVYSTTKTMTALTALMLADRGLIDFDAPVARYWPEFAQNGKHDVKVSHLMAHTAGLPGWTETLAPADIYDWDKVASLLAAQAPMWTPGAEAGYHALTQGYLVGEVIRRVSGKSVGTVFREDIAGPVGADFHIGLPESEDHRVADLVPPPVLAPLSADGQQSEEERRILSNPPLNPRDTRTRAWRGAEIPAAGGTSNARAVAEIHAAFVNGGVAKGRRILSEAGARKALDLQFEGTDRILRMPVRYGLGFGLAGGTVPFPNPNSMFWGGYGGSLALIDFDARTTFAFVMNKMGATTVGDLRAFSIAMAMWEALRG